MADTSGSRYPQHRGVVMATGGMVASAQPLASLAGVEVLRAGGNAIDAAIATAAVLNVTLPAMCGLGGDVFALVYWAPTGEVFGLNGSGIAPFAATPEYFLHQGIRKMPLEGILSVAVPGAVDAYTTLLGRFGTMDLARLFGPAIQYAERGFPVTERTSKNLHDHFEKLARYPTTARVLLPDGRAPKPGELLRQQDLAESLRQVAAGGSEAYYRGEIARAIVRFSEQNGGLFTEREFAEHATELGAPISTDYRGYTVCQTTLPSQGHIVLEELNIIEGYPLSEMGHNSADTIHTMVEAKKLAFADRLAYSGDPRFVPTPLKGMLSKEYATAQRRRIDPIRAFQGPPAPGNPIPYDLEGDTTYFAVVDGRGNAVSFIHSLSAAFGSGVIAGHTGILLNNRTGRGFTLEDGHPNRIEPGKRTMHTLNAYLILKDGKPWLVGGTPGGDRQPQHNMQVIANVVDFGMNVQQAVEAPRWFGFPGTDPEHVEKPYELRIEDRVPAEVRSELARRGHRIQLLGPWAGGGTVQLIGVDQEAGVLMGGSDPRGDGSAIGF